MKDEDLKRIQQHKKQRERFSMSSNSILAKQGLSAEQLAMVGQEVTRKGKSKGIAYALWWFTGILGGHRFYTGNVGIALGMLFTLGGFGVWSLIDVFFIGAAIERKNMAIEMQAINIVKAYGKNKEA